MKTSIRPSDLELQAMSVLWAAGRATVHEVLRQLPDGKCRAYTTVLTILQKLELKGLVRKTFNGHHNIYFPAKTREVTIGRFIHEMVQRIFRGSAADLIEQILAGVTLTPGETKAVAGLLMRRRRRPVSAAHQPNPTKTNTMAAKKKAAAKKAAPAKKAPAKKAAKKKAAKKKAPAKKVAKKK
jgi:predicted transcriptional regulator